MSTPPAAAPNSRAFHDLYRGEFAFVWAAARRFGVPAAIVEDAVQDVFLTAYRRLDQLRFEVSARAWLHGVTRRIAARYRRSGQRLDRRLAALAAQPPERGEALEDRLAAAQQLERSLARLDVRLRPAFEMAELLGMSGPEIAGELAIPVSTVYSRVRLAREQLRRELGAGPLEHALVAARACDTPPPEVAQRSWIALVPALRAPGSGVLLSLASARAVVMTTLVLGAAGVTALAWPGPRPAEVRPAAASNTRPSPLFAAPGIADDAGPSPPIVRPAGAARPSDHDADGLAAEVAVLDRARAALIRGSVAGARERLAEHARRFPDGALRDLRGATEVEILCHEHRPDEAAARAAALVREYPRSVVAQRLANFACPP